MVWRIWAFIVMTESNVVQLKKKSKISFGILTALVKDELVSCESLLQGYGWIEIKDIHDDLRRANVRQWKKAINGTDYHLSTMAFGEMGQSFSSVETLCFLQRCDPLIVFLTGIAGSLKRDKVFLRDVVVSLDVHWRGQNRISGAGDCDEYRVRNYTLPTYTPDLRRSIQGFAESVSGDVDRSVYGDFNINASSIFSWDYVIDSARVVDRINKDFPNAACVEMEGGGFQYAIDAYRRLYARTYLKGFIVRGISDYADGKVKVTNDRVAASRNASLVTVMMLDWILKKIDKSSNRSEVVQFLSRW